MSGSNFEDFVDKLFSQNYKKTLNFNPAWNKKDENYKFATSYFLLFLTKHILGGWSDACFKDTFLAHGHGFEVIGRAFWKIAAF